MADQNTADEITRINTLISGYKSDINSYSSSITNLQNSNKSLQTQLANLQNSIPNNNISNWAGITSVTATPGTVSVYKNMPANNSVQILVPTGASAEFYYDGDYYNAGYTSPQLSNISKDRYCTHEIDLQWNFQDVAISAVLNGNYTPNGQVCLVNKITKSYVLLQLLKPKSNSWSGINVRFATGDCIAIIAYRSANPTLGSDWSLGISQGDDGSVETSTFGAHTTKWGAGLNINASGYTSNAQWNRYEPNANVTYIESDKISYFKYVTKMLTAYFYLNKSVVTNNNSQQAKTITDQIAANDTQIQTLQTRINDTQKLLNQENNNLTAIQYGQVPATSQPVMPPNATQISQNLNNLKSSAATYANTINNFIVSRNALQDQNKSLQTQLANLQNSIPNNNISNWAGITSVTATPGTVSVYKNMPANNSVQILVPTGASAEIRYTGDFTKANYTSPEVSSITYSTFCTHTIDLQWNVQDTTVSAVYSSVPGNQPTGEVVLLNKSTKQYVLIQLLKPKASWTCGVNVRFATGDCISIFASRYYSAVSNGIDWEVALGAGDSGSSALNDRGPNTLNWFNMGNSQIVPRDTRVSYSELSSNPSYYIDIMTWPYGSNKYVVKNTNAYFWNNKSVVTNNNSQQAKTITDQIAANDAQIQTLQTRINDTQKLLDDINSKIAAESNKATTTTTPVVPVAPLPTATSSTAKTNPPTPVVIPTPTVVVPPTPKPPIPTPVVVPPTLPVVVPPTLPVTNITNVNITSKVVNNINKTNININIGTRGTKATTPKVQTPPPINLAALLSFFRSKK